MRKAQYDMKQVICRNASCIGFSSNIARPGYWLAYLDNGRIAVARVLGRIARTVPDGLEDCRGWLAVVRLADDARHAGIRWINPDDVRESWAEPPAKLLAWFAGSEWVKSKRDIARIVAMSQHGTLSDRYIENRNNPDQAYNARPEYVQQFILD